MGQSSVYFQKISYQPYHRRETINPSTGKSLGHVSSGDKADIDLAVKAATAAFNQVWGLKTAGHRRGRLMIELALAIEAHADTLAVRLFPILTSLPEQFTPA